MARTKLDLEETTNKVKDYKFSIKDKVLRFGMLIDRAKRVMRAYNRAYAIAAQQLAALSIEQLEDMAEVEE